MKRPAALALALSVAAGGQLLSAEDVFRFGLRGIGDAAGVAALHGVPDTRSRPEFELALEHEGDGPTAGGYQASLRATGGTILRIGVEGTDAESADFAVGRVTTGPGNEGAVLAVVLRFSGGVTVPPPNGVASIGRVATELWFEREPSELRLEFAGGLVWPSGEVSANVVTREGFSVTPETRPLALALVPDCAAAPGDSDGDGHADACDNCPATRNVSQSDRDRDGVGDPCDRCPDRHDPSQKDTDGDGHGDACDVCPEHFDPTQADADGDGHGDACDNCPALANAGQRDADGDLAGDLCDECPDTFNPGGDADPCRELHVPEMPRSFRALSARGRVELRWSAAPDAARAGYELLRSTADARAHASLATLPADASSFTDATAEIDATSRYVLVAFGPDGRGPASDPVEAAARSTVPELSFGPPRAVANTPSRRLLRARLAGAGVQGWTVELGAAGCRFAAVTTAGTIAASTAGVPAGLRSDGFERTELAGDDDIARSAVVLALDSSVTLPAGPAHDVLELVVQREPGSLEECVPCRVEFTGAVTAIDGIAVLPETTGLEVEICGGPPELFRRGDANGSGGLEISDGIFTLSYLFTGGARPRCLESADVDDSGRIDVTDAVRVFGYLFLGHNPPPTPGPATCGADPLGSDELGCADYSEC